MDVDVLTYALAKKYTDEHGGGSGATELNDLSDVEITNPTNGQILSFDEALAKFKNVAPVSSVIKTENDTGQGIYCFKVGATTGNSKEVLFGSFGAYGDATGVFLARTSFTQMSFSCGANYSSVNNRLFKNVVSTDSRSLSKRWDASTGKLYITIPDWEDVWFIGFLNIVTPKK